MTQSQSWCFTWNNPAADLFLSEDQASSHTSDAIVLPDYVQYLIYQKEVGENGTLHFQGYLETSRRVRLSQLKSIHQGIHWEVRRGTQAQAIAYASKRDTRADGPWEYGERRETRPGRRRDLEAVAGRIRDGQSFETIRDEFPAESIQFRRSIMEACREEKRREYRHKFRDVHVTVFYGDPGTGKTRSVYDTEGVENIFTLTKCHNGSIWFDGYDYEPVLLIDDFRGWIAFEMLLKILDRPPYRLAIKGSYDYAAWTKVYITSNHPIEDWYRSDAGHCIPALRRRIHRVEHFSSDHPWRPAEPSGDVVPSGESDVVTVSDESELDVEDE